VTKLPPGFAHPPLTSTRLCSGGAPGALSEPHRRHPSRSHLFVSLRRGTRLGSWRSPLPSNIIQGPNGPLRGTPTGDHAAFPPSLSSYTTPLLILSPLVHPFDSYCAGRDKDPVNNALRIRRPLGLDAYPSIWLGGAVSALGVHSCPLYLVALLPPALFFRSVVLV
jgi:hypothetical protein